MKNDPAPAPAPVLVGGLTITPIANPPRQVVAIRIMVGRPVPITIAPEAANAMPSAYKITRSTFSRAAPGVIISGMLVAFCQMPADWPMVRKSYYFGSCWFSYFAGKLPIHGRAWGVCG
ncbi:hypothetical protein ABVK25_006599 [Lepraria finkii]|uniref:Uncharacterized protein n=1 Tax=Lepraria finkii TaxID=1340010 RepID=A0ABR4B5Z7_9LECA